MKITAQMVVKNEENFIWYAINSVIDRVDEMLVWDNGSTDRTKSIIKLIASSKIKFAEVSGPIEVVRQKMLEATDADWIFILDGDEIWPGDAVADLRSRIYDLGNKIDAVVVPNYMLIGDIFHYQEKAAGKYEIGGKIGHYNIRAVKKTEGLHIVGIYPNEAFVNKDGIKVQDLPQEKILFFDRPYFHASFLKKKKYEIGESFPRDFYFPEVFFKTRPAIVPSPWKTMDLNYKLRAIIETPLKKIKRRII